MSKPGETNPTHCAIILKQYRPQQGDIGLLKLNGTVWGNLASFLISTSSQQIAIRWKAYGHYCYSETTQSLKRRRKRLEIVSCVVWWTLAMWLYQMSFKLYSMDCCPRSRRMQQMSQNVFQNHSLHTSIWKFSAGNFSYNLFHKYSKKVISVKKIKEGAAWIKDWLNLRAT